MPKFAVIITAAGRGQRFGGKRNKAFAKLQDRPLFIRAIELFVNREDVCQMILVVAGGDADHVKEQYGPNLGFMGVVLAIGGENRWQSVSNALELVAEDADFVAVHDAARICTTTEMIDRVFAGAVRSGAAVLAAPLSGTIKRVSAEGTVQQTVSRERLYEAQTPQVFEKDLLIRTYRSVEDSTAATDDADVVAAAGHDVAVIDSDLSNLKITFPGDLALAGAILKSRPKPKAARPRGPFEEAQW